MWVYDGVDYLDLYSFECFITLFPPSVSDWIDLSRWERRAWGKAAWGERREIPLCIFHVFETSPSFSFFLTQSPLIEKGEAKRRTRLGLERFTSILGALG